MKRKLIIDGNAVYELDEDCILGKRIDVKKEDAGKVQEEKYMKEYKKALKRTE